MGGISPRPPNFVHLVFKSTRLLWSERHDAGLATPAAQSSIGAKNPKPSDSKRADGPWAGAAQTGAGCCVLYTTAHLPRLEPGVQRVRAKVIEKVSPFVHDSGAGGI